jgi:2-polyprenyl-3-methyl-5-hydroxy-6-metoxy-1,4-benzoquinol methylase
MLCPIENSVTQPKFNKDGFQIRDCPVCHHQFVDLIASQEHVTQVYGDFYFTGGGAGYTNYLGESNIIIDHGRRYGKLLEKYMKPGRVLDVGAAAGFILKGLIEHGWDGLGLEPNASMVEYGRRQTGVNIEVSTLEQFRSDERFDLVTMIQVLPHYYDLKRALKVADNLTKSSGYWLIETWNKDSFTARVMGKYWHEYSPPSVLHFFSPKTLQLLVRQYGFEEVARGRPVKKISGSHAKSLLNYTLPSSTFGKLLGKLVDRLPDGLTLPYPSFDLFWVLYRKVQV